MFIKYLGIDININIKQCTRQWRQQSGRQQDFQWTPHAHSLQRNIGQKYRFKFEFTLNRLVIMVMDENEVLIGPFSTTLLLLFPSLIVVVVVIQCSLSFRCSQLLITTKYCTTYGSSVRTNSIHLNPEQCLPATRPRNCAFRLIPKKPKSSHTASKRSKKKSQNQ